MNEHGKVIDANTVRFERLLPGPLERVWSYLVDAEKRARWLCGGETELQVGGQVEMHFHNKTLSSDGNKHRPAKYKDNPEEFIFHGKVTRCDPPHLIAHTWDFEGYSSEVCYELSEQDDKVLLVLTHSKLRDAEEMLAVCGGWHAHLAVLTDVLDGAEVRSFWKSYSRYEAEYAAIIDSQA